MNEVVPETTRRFGWLALLALVIAAWTGVLLRFWLAGAMPAWAGDFAAVRHAHSHLMYFGWVTLALMTLIWGRIPRLTGRPFPRAATWQLGATAIAAFLSFPAFWINGYGLTAIGDAELPLGSMAASLCGLTWFWFMALYVRETRHLRQRSVAVQLWDWALVLLLIACLGAAGLVSMVFLNSESIALQLLFLHIFLDLFAVGWFSLATLGLLWDRQHVVSGETARLPVMTLALALAPTFVLGMPPVLVPVPLAMLGLVANAVAALLLGWHFVTLWHYRDRFTWFGRFGLLLFGIYIGSALILSWPPLWRWAAATQLRVYYLHLFLLGWISSMVLELLIQRMYLKATQAVQWLAYIWIVGVSALLLSLLGIGLIAWSPLTMVQLMSSAAWSSILPAVVATAMLALPLLKRNMQDVINHF